jgi:two-component system sensor histidine kinase/response regulator
MGRNTSHSDILHQSSLDILLAEDDPINQRLAVLLLERMGHRVSLAKDGFQVLEALDRDKFDLVLMDVLMPNLDGLEATKRIRKGGSEIPIVAMTAYAMEGDRDRCLEAGMDDYISKPIDPVRLSSVVAMIIPDAESVAKEEAPRIDTPFDLDATLDLVAGDLEVYGDLVDLFVESAPLWLSDIRTAATEGDFDVLERTAHTLKGSASSFGAEATARNALLIETNARERVESNYDPLVEELEVSVDSLSRVLRASIHNSE